MNIFRIKTTSWQEEDFILMTTLTEEQIDKVLSPIVDQEREGSSEYDNDSLVKDLEDAYPLAIIEQYSTELTTIII
jgi:hypothetical protein